jgi:hypothetical protein
VNQLEKRRNIKMMPVTQMPGLSGSQLPAVSFSRLPPPGGGTGGGGKRPGNKSSEKGGAKKTGGGKASKKQGSKGK